MFFTLYPLTETYVCFGLAADRLLPTRPHDVVKRAEPYKACTTFLRSEKMLQRSFLELGGSGRTITLIFYRASFSFFPYESSSFMCNSERLSLVSSVVHLSCHCLRSCIKSTELFWLHTRRRLSRQPYDRIAPASIHLYGNCSISSLHLVLSFMEEL